MANKSERSFYAHCLDSFVLTLFANSLYRLHSMKTVFLDRRPAKKRRDLFQVKKRLKTGKEYYRFEKGGVRVTFDHYSKLKKIRVKMNDSKSNHGPWSYQYTKRVTTAKKFKKPFGGRVYKETGNPKYWSTENKWYSYDVRSMV